MGTERMPFFSLRSIENEERSEALPGNLMHGPFSFRVYRREKHGICIYLDCLCCCLPHYSFPASFPEAGTRSSHRLAVRVARSLTHQDVLEVLTELFCERGVPVHLRSDNGSEFTARRVRTWLSKLEVRPLFIEPGSPWENGYIESFNGKMRDELLAPEIFYSLKEAQIMIEMWRKEYNMVRPHSSLGYRPPAPSTILIQSSQFQQVGLT